MSGDNRAEIDAILATLPPGNGPVAHEIREQTLAAEVLRLRAALAVAEGLLVEHRDYFTATEADVGQARIEGALAAGCRRFTHRNRDGWFALVTPSTRPDCPAGKWQLTRLDGEGPFGHDYATLGAEMARELWLQGFDHPTPPKPPA